MLRVKDVDYQGDYRLALTFSDGAHKVVDLEPLLHGEVFGSLRDKEQFIQYALTPLLSNGLTALIWLPNISTR